jgi:hypothetical protein
VSDSTPAGRVSPLVDNTLRKFQSLLTQFQGKGLDVLEPKAALTALRSHDDLRPLDGSPLCRELTAVVQCLETLAGQQPTDELEINETLKQVAEVLRAMAPEAERHSPTADPKNALRLIRETLSGVPEAEVGRIIGAPYSEAVTWSRVGVPLDMVRRVRIAAGLILDLRRGMGARDIPRWFKQRHDSVGGKTGLQLLERGTGTDVQALQRLAHSPQRAL